MDRGVANPQVYALSGHWLLMFIEGVDVLLESCDDCICIGSNAVAVVAWWRATAAIYYFLVVVRSDFPSVSQLVLLNVA